MDYKLNNEQMSIMLSYWIAWTFTEDFLNDITKEHLQKLIVEFNDYELVVRPKVDAKTMLWAWEMYFDITDKLTPEIQDKLDQLEEELG